MAVREINLNRVLKTIFEKTAEIMPKATAHMANTLIEFAHKMWHSKASKSGPWGSRYATTIVSTHINAKSGTGEAKVFIDESHSNFLFVNLVEEGVETWDIKKALLEGKAARRNQAKYGTRFVRVPFRWRVPGKSKKTSSFAGVMPKDIYEDAKSGNPIVKRSIETGRKAIDVSGLKRFGGEKHGQYMTFRTVSDKSEGWQYPSRKSTPVFNEVVGKVEKMIGQMITNLIQDFEKDLLKTYK